jgi:hypothetical protein
MSALQSRPPVPDFVASVYQPGTLDRVGSTLAVLDTRCQILWVNEAWLRFAEAGGCDFALERYPSYLDGIAGPLRDEYEQVLATVVATGKVFEQDYECSTPETIRHYRMRVLPFLPDGLLVEHTPIASHAAPPGEPAIEELYLGEDQQIVQCSNCRRVRRPFEQAESWAWVPEWVAHSHPRTSHGMCTPCMGYYWRRPRRQR